MLVTKYVSQRSWWKKLRRALTATWKSAFVRPSSTATTVRANLSSNQCCHKFSGSNTTGVSIPRFNAQPMMNFDACHILLQKAVLSRHWFGLKLMVWSEIQTYRMYRKLQRQSYLSEWVHCSRVPLNSRDANVNRKASAPHGAIPLGNSSFWNFKAYCNSVTDNKPAS